MPLPASAGTRGSRRRLTRCAGLLAGTSLGAAAAPLDALLSAEPVRLSAPDRPVWQIELSRDLANERLDVLGLRASSAYAGTNIGDYAGQHEHHDDHDPSVTSHVDSLQGVRASRGHCLLAPAPVPSFHSPNGSEDRVSSPDYS